MGLFDGDSKTANAKEGGKGRKQEKDKSNTKKRFVQLFLTLHLSRPAFTSFFQYCWMKYGWMKPTVKFPEEFLPRWAPPSVLSTELSVCLRGLLPVHVWCVVLGNLHVFGTIAFPKSPIAQQYVVLQQRHVLGAGRARVCDK